MTEPTNPVELIVVVPKKHNKFIYYINDNSDNAHYADSAKILLVVSEYLHGPVLNEIREHLKFHRSFVVFTTENSCMELEHDVDKQREKIKNSALMIGAKTAHRKSKKEQEESDPYSFANSKKNLLKEL